MSAPLYPTPGYRHRSPDRRWRRDRLIQIVSHQTNEEFFAVRLRWLHLSKLRLLGADPLRTPRPFGSGSDLSSRWSGRLAASQNNDQYTSNPAPAIQRRSRNNDGGSLLYDSVNPSWLNVLGSVGIRLSRQFFITGGVEATVAGQDTALGTRFLVGLGYSTVPTRTAQGTRPEGEEEREEFKPVDHSDNGAGFDVDTSTEDATIPGEKLDNDTDSKQYPNQKIFAPTR